MKFNSLITEAISTGNKVYLLAWENSWEDDTGEGYQLYGVYTSPAKAYEGYRQFFKDQKPSDALKVLECVLDPEDARATFFTNFKEVDIEHLSTLTNIGPKAAEDWGDVIKGL